MKYVTLLALPLLIAAVDPALYVDAECVHNGLNSADRASITRGLTQSDPPLTKAQEDKNSESLTTAALTCAGNTPWSEERTGQVTQLAFSLMLYNHALPGLATALIDPSLISKWYRNQPMSVQTTMFTPAMSETETEKLIQNLFAELESKGVSAAAIEQFAGDIAYMLSALSIRIQAEAVSSPK